MSGSNSPPTLISSSKATLTRANTKVDQLFSKWDHPDSPGAAVVVVKDGAVIYQRGYGSANLEQRIPITSQTVFDAASEAKQFTGLAIAILVERGKLSLNDDVRKHLPEVPDLGTPITVRHLLYHTTTNVSASGSKFGIDANEGITGRRLQTPWATVHQNGLKQLKGGWPNYVVTDNVCRR